ncbi:50S ribosomal protein L25 [Aureliella helgolandensis]|uniref:Large ribosomal subunit protein bL25 n=1 Tax=Aureliella helgolandensis TaxID=2527968 RepID=A0A518GDN1_9BACT|nr:50S ribosomal protein L25 [Aureliella helgolandensis]QDV26709.1 50S ribosomal protein L25 [Aureliella helgolandensis]
MSSETIEVKKREQVGTAACNKLRATGYVPANLYGHGEANVNLAVRHDAIGNVIKHGTKILALTGDISDTALLRDVQWDAFGMEVLHVDFTRVSKGESVEVTLPLHLHGEAPGTSQGGILGHVLHELTILCPASAVPEDLQVNIAKLNLGEAIHASEIEIPAGASLVTDGGELVVHIVKPAGATEDADAADEPEVIGQADKQEDAN